MIQLLETEEDACLLVAAFVANLLNEGQVGSGLTTFPAQC